MKRLKNALAVFWVALRKPESINVGMLRLAASIFDFLSDTAEHHRPMSAKVEMKMSGVECLGKIVFNDEALLTLWCGFAEKSNPIHRIRELGVENEELRKLIAEYHKKLYT